MSLRDTITDMRDLLNNITGDLEKAEGGNKAASQRVRTGTVQLEKIAKKYRKESIDAEKQPRTPRKTIASNSSKKPAAKAAAPAGKSKAAAKAPHHTPTATAKIKAKPKAAAIAKARPRALAVKRPTAKLPTRAPAFR